jgi:capsular exopolysaccharide synthesis family protein
MKNSICVAEAFGEVVNALLFTTKNLTQQRWLITSASAGEGKTISAIGLASTMALRNKKILLIDANLHNPSISKRCVLGTPGGLIEVLHKEWKLEEALQEIPEIRNLFVLGAGNGNVEPYELLKGKRMQEFLDKMQHLFDFIIIDSPALEGALDALLLAPHVEGCVMVVQAEKTGRSAVLKARNEIEEAGGKLLGVIFNREKERIPKIFRRWV